jgi:lipopolysaccharide/colanic/teichoic acid biosynthesis glycosyltransferase
MRTPSPASRGAFRFSLSLFDISWIVLSPAVSLYICNAYVLFLADGLQTVVLYSVVSTVSAALAFLAFRVEDGIPKYFSVYDAIEITKAVVAAELVTCIVLFSSTRLEGIPRSAPVAHALVLIAGLVIVKVAKRLRAEQSGSTSSIAQSPQSESVLVIGSNELSSIYIKLTRVTGGVAQRVLGILDHRPKLIGRLLDGVSIIGAPQHLAPLADEYQVHGVKIDRVLVAGRTESLSPDELKQLRQVCAARLIKLEFIPDLLGVKSFGVKADNDQPVREGEANTTNWLTPSPYFRIKPALDFVAAALLIIMLAPIFLIVSVLTLIDVGSPVLFWQQRPGLRGRNFLLYKFRTLRPPFDGRGNPIPPERRLSWIGHLLRDTSLDEIPQLLNVLVGDMSLIGPRPLLPEDQPARSSGRLSVRPGITGWAQINGGKLLTAEEKLELDEWYIHNASLLVDFRLLLKTLEIILLGARRSSEAALPPASSSDEHWQRVGAADLITKLRRETRNV